MELTNRKAARSRSKRNWIWVGLVGALIIGGTAWFLTQGTLPGSAMAAATQAPSYYTTPVRQGTLRVSANGAGVLIASTQADLSFPVAGVVAELNVQPGDQVKKGDVLAQLVDLDSLDAAITSAQLSLAQAQNSLASLEANAAISLAEAYKAWVDAQGVYADALFTDQRTAYSRCSQDTNTKLTEQLKQLGERLAKAVEGTDEYLIIKSEYETTSANLTYCLSYTGLEKTNASASLQVAQSQMDQAKAAYDLLAANNGIDPDQLAELQNAVDQAEDNLALAQQNRAAAVMSAPMNGTVISVAAGAGESVDTSTFITIADLSQPAVTVSVDETDIDKLKVGNRAEVVFDAFPDLLFTGVVSQVNPSLSQSGQSQAATGVIQLDPVTDLDTPLILSLNASVEVIVSEAENALIVPVEALRDLGGGDYAVFVLENGQLTLKPVEIGLSDGTYTEIRSGLTLGEQVSTGITEVR